MITTEQIKELRDSTGISIMQCKKALEEAGGDVEKALAILKKKSGELALKRKDKPFGAGIVQAYVHATLKVASLVELVCETDFVSGNDEFKTLARDIAMHITASNPIEEAVLLSQPFIKNPEVNIEGLILAASQKFGEKIAIARFTRFAVLEK